MEESVDAVEVDGGAESHPFIGLLLSVVSAVLVGSSFILQKKGILRTVSSPAKQGTFYWRFMRCIKATCFKYTFSITDNGKSYPIKLYLLYGPPGIL